MSQRRLRKSINQLIYSLTTNKISIYYIIKITLKEKIHALNLIPLRIQSSRLIVLLINNVNYFKKEITLLIQN